MQRQPKRIQAVRQLLGLALIGFVLWLAVIGWLPVATAGTAPGGMRHGDPEARLAHLQTELQLTDAQVDQIRPILETQSARARELMDNIAAATAARCARRCRSCARKPVPPWRMC